MKSSGPDRILENDLGWVEPKPPHHPVSHDNLLLGMKIPALPQPSVIKYFASPENFPTKLRAYEQLRPNTMKYFNL